MPRPVPCGSGSIPRSSSSCTTGSRRPGSTSERSTTRTRGLRPKPSQTDINFAKLWPGVLWIIVGLVGDEAEVRTWRIEGGQVSDAELVVE